jgi:hypothetical protein
MHADRVVAFVVVDDRDDRCAVLLGGREFLAGHEKPAVADMGDHGAMRMR